MPKLVWAYLFTYLHVIQKAPGEPSIVTCPEDILVSPDKKQR